MTFWKVLGTGAVILAAIRIFFRYFTTSVKTYTTYTCFTCRSSTFYMYVFESTLSEKSHQWGNSFSKRRSRSSWLLNVEPG